MSHAAYVQEATVKAEVDEFIDNKDGTSTLVVTCAKGNKVRFKIPTKRIKSINVDVIYAILEKECLYIDER